MDIMDGMSLDLEQTNRDNLQAVFPECFSEGKLDIDKLLSLCGEYITNDFEKYKFEWKGKSECLQLAQKRSTGTLRPNKDESVNFDETKNVYIKGDNLEVLKLLQTSYYRKIKMIYIDPPYNTGNDFVYEDDFADPINRYKEVTEQTTKSNPETMGRYHTNWLNMMYPRLRLAANLLRDDGVIFISIDDNEVTNLRKICDEVFGEENFVAQIVWQKRTSPANDAQWYSSDHEYLVVYAKNKLSWKPERSERTEEQDKYYKNPDNDPRGAYNAATYTCNKSRSERPSLYYGIINPFTGLEVFPDENAVWKFAYEKHLENEKNNLLYWGAGGQAEKPRIKRFLSEAKKIVPRSFWNYSEVGSTQTATSDIRTLFDGAAFPYPKPVGFIKKAIYQATKENDIILDFFSGSATTAHAVMKLNSEDGGNRRFICVQLPELCGEKSEAYKAGYKNICDIGMERIRRAGQKILSEKENDNPLDVGFKVFELDTSNLKTWDGSPVDENYQIELLDRMNEMLERVKPDRTDIDMVYEIILKTGKGLTETITPFEIDGKTAYDIGYGGMVICLAEDLTPEILEKICERKPSKLIIGKDGLKDDTAMSNALYICQDRNIELKLV